MESRNAPILNSDRVGKRVSSWHHIEVSGEHPALVDQPDGSRKRYVQVIDREALQSMVNRFLDEAEEPNFDGMLVDKDHLSHNRNHTTESMAWLHALEIRNGELYGYLEWTDEGATAVQNKRYKFFSTEYSPEDLEDLGDGRVRPLRLAGLALTNRPNNKGGKPILNRDADAGDPGAASESNQQNEEVENKMKSIAEKLGLEPDASEEEILAALSAALEELESLRNNADEMKKDADAEEVLNRLKDRIPEGTRDKWKSAIIANRADAEALLESMPVIENREKPRKPITNRTEAKTPGTERATGGEQKDTARDQSKFVAEIKNRDKCDFNRAWETAKGERPELFG